MAVGFERVWWQKETEHKLMLENDIRTELRRKVEDSSKYEKRAETIDYQWKWTFCKIK